MDQKQPSAASPKRRRRDRRLRLWLLIAALPLLLIGLLPQLLQLLLPPLLSDKGVQQLHFSARWSRAGLEIGDLRLETERLQLALPILNLVIRPFSQIQTESQGGWLLIKPGADKPKPVTADNGSVLRLPQLPIALKLQLKELELKNEHIPPLWLNASGSADNERVMLSGQLVTASAQKLADISFSHNPDDGASHLKGEIQGAALPATLIAARLPEYSELGQALLQHRLALNCEGALTAAPGTLPSADCDFTLSPNPDSALPLKGQGNLLWQPNQLQLEHLELERLPAPGTTTVPPLPIAAEQHPFWSETLPHRLELNAQLKLAAEQYRINANLALTHPDWQLELNPSLEPGHSQYRLTLPLSGHYQSGQIAAAPQGELELALMALDTLESALLLPGSHLQFDRIRHGAFNARQLRLQLTERPLGLQPGAAEQGLITINLEKPRRHEGALPDLALQLLPLGALTDAPTAVSFELKASGARPLKLSGQIDPLKQEVTLHSRRETVGKLAALLKPLKRWPEGLLLEQGSLTGALTLKLAGQPSGRINLSLHQLQGYFNDNRFSGVDARVRLPFSGDRFGSSRSTLTVETLDIGWPIHTIDARFRLGGPIKSPWLNLEQLHLNTLGGKVHAGGLRYSPYRSYTGTVQLERIELGELVALYDQPGVIANGRISGELPLIISREGVSLKQGHLYALPPGGQIQLAATPAIAQLKANQPSLKLAFDLLENLHYRELSARADFNHQGELDLFAQIKGANPDLFGGQEIHFNYRHQENLLQLIKSLQLADEIHSGLDSYFNPAP